MRSMMNRKIIEQNVELAKKLKISSHYDPNKVENAWLNTLENQLSKHLKYTSTPSDETKSIRICVLKYCSRTRIEKLKVLDVPLSNLIINAYDIKKGLRKQY